MNKPNLPKTSHAANAQAKELKLKHQQQILTILEHHPEGLTYEEIADCCQLDKHAVGRRLSELERLILIHKPGTMKDTSTGRKAYVYKSFSIVDYSRALTQPSLFPVDQSQQIGK